jgi:hypothetical protein
LKKKLSKEHEQAVAKRLNGRRSPSSGASDTDKGDVSTEAWLIECKGKFGQRIGQNKVKSTLVGQMEKVADEAWAMDKDPMVALRFYMPDSLLADNEGYVDLIVMRMADYEVC